MSQRDWNDHYAQGFMPWDSDEPDEKLVEFVSSQRLAPCRVLDIGCGTGTHSLWLAEQGFDVLGVSLSALAIGSTEGPARDHGPPRRSVRDIASAIEPVLEIALLKTIDFDAELPSRAAAWLCLARQREVPAQPSTVFRLA